ncbi:MAG: hypothetical protein F6K42_26150 [Leptolyngbya sp. SIO1D8]|nr:hypothetical protein [Leptolyngbya sp. SIO1D8]
MTARYPSTDQWRLFQRYQDNPPPLSPEQFLRYWQVSYSDLAQLAGCSRSTVEHWFIQGASRREPTLAQRRRLVVVHRLWPHAQEVSPCLMAICEFRKL